MPDENGKKLQDLMVQGIALVLVGSGAGFGGSYFAPDPLPVKDPEIAVLQEQVRHMHVELVNAETALVRNRTEIGTLKGRVDMIGQIQMMRMGIQ